MDRHMRLFSLENFQSMPVHSLRFISRKNPQLKTFYGVEKTLLDKKVIRKFLKLKKLTMFK